MPCTPQLLLSALLKRQQAGTSQGGAPSLEQITYLLLIWGSDTYTSGAVRVHATYDPAIYYSKHLIPYTTQTNPTQM